MVGRNGVTGKILESKINEETDRNEESNSKEKKKRKKVEARLWALRIVLRKGNKFVSGVSRDSSHVFLIFRTVMNWCSFFFFSSSTTVNNLMRIIYTMNRRLACKRLITKMDATNNHARIIHKGDTIESKDSTWWSRRISKRLSKNWEKILSRFIGCSISHSIIYK